MAHLWPTLHRISYQWSLVAACLRPTGVDSPTAPSPFPHHPFTFFHIASWSLMDLSLETGAQLPPTLQLHVPFSFPSASSFYPLAVPSSLISTAPKELITSSFLILSSFPAESFSFLASFPLHPTDFLSLKLEIVFITVKHEKQDFPQVNWDDLSFGKITPKQTF